MLLDLSISGQPVTGTNTLILDEFPRLLGVDAPDKKHGLSIRTKWLEEYLKRMPPHPIDEQLMQHLRAYLLYFFGRFLLPDTSDDRVHTMYLPLLEDIDTIRSYSWGSTSLTLLYRGLCDAATSKKSSPTIYGCVILLQAWAHSRIKLFKHQRVLEPPANRPLTLR
jgi:hypothetical protein